jgi:hypothetical protein
VSARERLVALRRALVAVVLARAAIVGGAVVAGGAIIAHALSRPSTIVLGAMALGLGVALALGSRVRPARSLERVALWVEERHPTLRYAVVTVAGGVASGAVEAQALALPWWDDARRRLARSLLVPSGVLALALAVLVWRPVLVHRAATSTNATATEGGRAPRASVDPLASLRATVTPPAYAARATTSADDPTSIDALVGSTVTVTGVGDAALVRATLDSTPRAVAARGGRWSLTFLMPARPALLRLRSVAGAERLVVLAPIIDAPPAVTLLLPARDTVVRAATGSLVLRAQLRDDIGLRDAAFEVIISTGQEENFTFRTATLSRTTLSGRIEGVLEARLSLDSVALKPGDMLQLRAVARDANDVSGPGVGSSETRAIRVARAGEYDSVAVDAAPPGEPEGQVLSQRMLIMLTQALEKRRPNLPRTTLLDESRRIAVDQARLRKRVGDVVFQRTGADPLSEESNIDAPTAGGKLTPEELLKRASEATGADAGAVMDVEGDETPILAVNKPLLEAFNAMWDAGRALEQGETRQALPPMRRALAAIERARQAERIYLRGRPSAVVVDVARARLAGKDKGDATVREPRPVIDPVARRRGETFARATALLSRDPAAAADSLLVMRVGALGDAPALAAVLDDAARVLRRGDARQIGLAWARVRRALGGAPLRRDSLPAWGGAP